MYAIVTLSLVQVRRLIRADLLGMPCEIGSFGFVVVFV
jgi:hypothetical protein